ncbi:ubiquitin conjugating enzyme E2 B-like [Saccoglossus kowalevskii]
MNFKKQLASRLKKELTAVQRSPPFGITVYLPDDNLHVWNAEIKGPAGSLYEGGTFKIQITLPENYPMEPPVVSIIEPPVEYRE